MLHLILRFLPALVALVLLVPVASAQQSLPGSSTPQNFLEVQGLALDPFLIEADVQPEIVSEHEIRLVNTTANPLPFAVSLNDFKPHGLTGQPLFLESNEAGDPRYSLSNWITITKQPEFIIPPRGETTVRFSLTPPANAEPGTHYGGILFHQPSQTVPDSGAEVRHKAGVIILARLGKAQEQGRISEFFTGRQIYQKGPIEFFATYHNYGNVHSKPKGDITIRNSFGRIVTQVPINRDAAIVLPESERDFSAEWRPAWAFGRYTAEAVMYFGNPKLEVRVVTSFWVIPLVPLVFAVLLIIAGITVGYFLVMRYNKYIIKRYK